jgi:hypothetical protein
MEGHNGSADFERHSIKISFINQAGARALSFVQIRLRPKQARRRLKKSSAANHSKMKHIYCAQHFNPQENSIRCTLRLTVLLTTAAAASHQLESNDPPSAAATPVTLLQSKMSSVKYSLTSRASSVWPEDCNSQSPPRLSVLAELNGE